MSFANELKIIELEHQVKWLQSQVQSAANVVRGVIVAIEENGDIDEALQDLKTLVGDE
jgi:hypothetical protein